MSDSPFEPTSICIHTKDQVQMSISVAASAMSEVIQEQLQAHKDRTKPLHIYLQDVNGETLSKVLQFCEYHKFRPYHETEELSSKPTTLDSIDKWDSEFIASSDLFDLIVAATELRIKTLLDLAYAKLAFVIEYTPSEELDCKEI